MSTLFGPEPEESPSLWARVASHPGARKFGLYAAGAFIGVVLTSVGFFYEFREEITEPRISLSALPDWVVNPHGDLSREEADYQQGTRQRLCHDIVIRGLREAVARHLAQNQPLARYCDAWNQTRRNPSLYDQCDAAWIQRRADVLEALLEAEDACLGADLTRPYVSPDGALVEPR